MTLKRFVSFKGDTYTFPTTVREQDFRTNFQNLLQRNSRMPGMDGGYREAGIGRSPSPVGSIQFTIYLVSTSRAAMQVKRDLLNQMQDWGMGLLYDELNGVERWAVCSVSNVSPSEERHKHTDLHQPVQMSFEAPEPFWLTAGNQKLWDSTYTIDSSISYDQGSYTTITGSGNITVSPDGSAYTHGRVVLNNTGSGNIYGINIRRIEHGRIADEVVYAAGQGELPVPAFQPGLTMEIDPRQKWALVYGYDATSMVKARHPEWLRLKPGSNTIQIVLDDASAQVSAAVFYYERYV